MRRIVVCLALTAIMRWLSTLSSSCCSIVERLNRRDRDAHYLAAAPEVKRTCDLLDRLEAPPDFVPFALYGVQCPEVKMGADAHRQAREIRELEDAFNGVGDTETIDAVAIAQAAEFEALLCDVPAYEGRRAA